MDINLIQNVLPTNCPHCSKLIFISYQFGMPSINSIYGEEEVKTAKESVLKKIKENKDINEEQKLRVEKWVMNPKTLFGVSDVDTVIDNIIQSSNDNLKEVKTN
jgi:hypothetical protein